MQIAKANQRLLQIALQAAQGLEPITFCSMFDGSVDYLFTMVIPLLRTELENSVEIIPIDLSGIRSELDITGEIARGLSEYMTVNEHPLRYSELLRLISMLSQKRKMVFVFYLGQEGEVEPAFFLFLNRLRNLLGWNVTYMLYITTRTLWYERLQGGIMDKVIRRNLVTITPKDDESMGTILHNYEERYNKSLPHSLARSVIRQSGGNAGLLKSLYLMAKDGEDIEHPDLFDERISFRIRGIADDIPFTWRPIITQDKSSKALQNAQAQLIQFGYIKKQGKSYIPFTPLLTTFFKTGSESKQPLTSEENKILHFTQTQRKVLAYLETHPGKLTSRDALAEVLWGEHWADNYSDWAIDQLLSTLREKLTSMKYQGKIVTKKGEGVIYLPTSDTK